MQIVLDRLASTVESVVQIIGVDPTGTRCRIADRLQHVSHRHPIGIRFVIVSKIAQPTHDNIDIADFQIAFELFDQSFKTGSVNIGVAQPRVFLALHPQKIDAAKSTLTDQAGHL